MWANARLGRESFSDSVLLSSINGRMYIPGYTTRELRPVVSKRTHILNPSLEQTARAVLVWATALYYTGEWVASAAAPSLSST